MNKESPLISRVRKEQKTKKIRIPRKGRIRFLLIIIIIFLAIWFYRRNTSASSHERPDAIDSSSVPSKTMKNGKPAPQNKKNSTARNKPLLRFSIKPMSFDEVCLLIQRVKPRFENSQDTVVEKGRELVLYYSIDTAIQRIGKKYLRRYHPKYGAITVIEPSTGRVVGLVSYTNDQEEHIGENLCLRSIFPAASVFKTITAAGAIEKAGLTLQSKLETKGKNHTLYTSQLEERLHPYREVTFQEAFAYSINPIFGRIGIYLLGSNGLREYAQKFGFNATVPFELSNEKAVFNTPESTFTIAEVASGFNKVTTISPLFGALIAAGISHEGKIFSPTLVDSIVDIQSGICIYKRKKTLWRNPIQHQTAKQIEALMQQVARYGTARKAFRYVKQSSRFKNIQYGGKTGNISKDDLGRIDWFVGFARHETDLKQHIATAVVTVHGAYWTVHSSYIGAEMMRRYIRTQQISQQKENKNTDSGRSVENKSEKNNLKSSG